MIGNDTIFGQIATFIDGLHLTYKEVTEEIPYRVLLLMSKDKQRIVTGAKVNKTTGKEMMARRKGNRKKENNPK